MKNFTITWIIIIIALVFIIYYGQKLFHYLKRIIQNFLNRKNKDYKEREVSEPRQKVTSDNAKSTLDRINRWVTWMMGIQTAAIGAAGLLLKDKMEPPTHIHIAPPEVILYIKQIAVVAILFFGVSIILTTTIYSAIASVQQRLTITDNDDPSENNDVFLMRIYTGITFQLGKILTVIHFYFLFGLIAFGYLIYEGYVIG